MEQDYMATFWAPVLTVLPVFMIAIILEVRHLSRDPRMIRTGAIRDYIKLCGVAIAYLFIAFVITAIALAFNWEPDWGWRLNTVIAVTFGGLVTVIFPFAVISVKAVRGEE